MKLQSRIDVPRPGLSVEPGDTVIAGMAWLPHSGASGVEVQVDGGAWHQAELGYEISSDTWVQWHLPWKATPGSHTIRCRAIDATGARQTSRRAPVVPDGATGWDEIQVTVK